MNFRLARDQVVITIIIIIIIIRRRRRAFARLARVCRPTIVCLGSRNPDVYTVFILLIIILLIIIIIIVIIIIIIIIIIITATATTTTIIIIIIIIVFVSDKIKLHILCYTLLKIIHDRDINKLI